MHIFSVVKQFSSSCSSDTLCCSLFIGILLAMLQGSLDEAASAFEISLSVTRENSSEIVQASIYSTYSLLSLFDFFIELLQALVFIGMHKYTEALANYATSEAIIQDYTIDLSKPSARDNKLRYVHII